MCAHLHTWHLWGAVSGGSSHLGASLLCHPSSAGLIWVGGPCSSVSLQVVSPGCSRGRRVLRGCGVQPPPEAAGSVCPQRAAFPGSPADGAVPPGGRRGCGAPAVFVGGLAHSSLQYLRSACRVASRQCRHRGQSLVQGRPRAAPVSVSRRPGAARAPRPRVGDRVGAAVACGVCAGLCGADSRARPPVPGAPPRGRPQAWGKSPFSSNEHIWAMPFGRWL